MKPGIFFNIIRATSDTLFPSDIVIFIFEKPYLPSDNLLAIVKAFCGYSNLYSPERIFPFGPSTMTATFNRKGDLMIFLLYNSSLRVEIFPPSFTYISIFFGKSCGGLDTNSTNPIATEIKNKMITYLKYSLKIFFNWVLFILYR